MSTFAYASAFNQPLDWDVALVESFSGMFESSALAQYTDASLGS